MSASDSLQGKRILVVSAVFPPDIIGGAEMSAANLAKWLQGQGAEVAVLTTAKNRSEISSGEIINGFKTWRVWMPRLYPKFYFAKAKLWQKPIWHLQDHFDPRNRKIMAAVLDQFKPDQVNIHVLQGLGYNSLAEIAKRNIPTAYYLHDLSLICFRMAMFKEGKECSGLCAPCRLSASYKFHQIKKFSQLGFCSPSQANLKKVAQFLPIKRWPHTAIMNVNRYPTPTLSRSESNIPRLLYVGRLHNSKGIPLLLNALKKLSASHAFNLIIIGSGPEEAHYRAQFGKESWCHFTGFISQQEISDYMINSDLLCLPSIWMENSPGVAIHALSLGLPVIGSNKGGIPELVEHEKNGLLVEASDQVAWEQALEQILVAPHRLQQWRDYAVAHKMKFDQDYIGNQMIQFIRQLVAPKSEKIKV